LGTGATGSSEGRRDADRSNGTGPAIEACRIPQNEPPSGEKDVCECEAPDGSKGQAMTSPAKRRMRSFIAVDLMGSLSVEGTDWMVVGPRCKVKQPAHLRPHRTLRALTTSMGHPKGCLALTPRAPSR
jgi:hypothetical protein